MHGLDEGGRARELGDDAVEVGRQFSASLSRSGPADAGGDVAGEEAAEEAHARPPAALSAGSPFAIVRISKIEMTGRNRMKRNMSEKKRPSDPM